MCVCVVREDRYRGAVACAVTASSPSEKRRTWVRAESRAVLRDVLIPIRYIIRISVFAIAARALCEFG